MTQTIEDVTPESLSKVQAILALLRCLAAGDQRPFRDDRDRTAA
jgi:hypothetical protein